MTDRPAYRQKRYRIMKKKRMPMWKIGSWGGSWVFIWSAFAQRWSGVGGWVGGIGSRHRSFWEPVVGRILPETRIRAVHPHPPDKAHPPMDESCPPKCDLSHCWWQKVLKNYFTDIWFKWNDWYPNCFVSRKHWQGSFFSSVFISVFSLFITFVSSIMLRNENWIFSSCINFLVLKLWLQLLDWNCA